MRAGVTDLTNDHPEISNIHNTKRQFTEEKAKMVKTWGMLFFLAIKDMSIAIFTHIRLVKHLSVTNGLLEAMWTVVEDCLATCGEKLNIISKGSSAQTLQTRNSSFRYIHWRNACTYRKKHVNKVYCSVIYQSQSLKITQVSINGRMKNE